MKTSTYLTAAALALGRITSVLSNPLPSTTLDVTVRSIDSDGVTHFDESTITLEPEIVARFETLAEQKKRGISKRAESIYHGWDDKKDADQKELAQLQQGQRDAVKMVSTTWDYIEKGNIYDNWFGEADKPKVKGIFASPLPLPLPSHPTIY